MKNILNTKVQLFKIQYLKKFSTAKKNFYFNITWFEQNVYFILAAKASVLMYYPPVIQSFPYQFVQVKIYILKEKKVQSRVLLMENKHPPPLLIIENNEGNVFF